ncbi:MAG: glycoside hydrolase family 65 [Oscillospiraceae bacterium]|nr:glycoside hydrolase family 65 [Oscillospiraceae bacterium]
MIDRKSLVGRHNPLLRAPDPESPLTVGNGEFAFTADVTGLQTLYDDYEIFPLCTMSQWGWHTQPNEDGSVYTLADLEMTRYAANGREYIYPALRRPGNELVYDRLRQNPHRLNLARVSLLWRGKRVRARDITDARQELDLYTGRLRSDFTLCGTRVSVVTVCAGDSDTLGFSIEESGIDVTVELSFPYGSHEKHASDWLSPEKHTTTCARTGIGCYLFERALHSTRYYALLNGADSLSAPFAHRYVFTSSAFTLTFAPAAPRRAFTFGEVERNSEQTWEGFWLSGGAADFSGSKDPRARELERRAVLSQYLCAAQCAGSLPPQETGLSCNSWYGKFHLEMHILHSGWFPLWGREWLLEKSFAWYKAILGKAKENAARNGFRGARWPKMTGPEGVDSPSRIAPLLIWQQPHILYMLELTCLAKTESSRRAFMREYWEVVRETAEFMCDFPVRDKLASRLNLAPPLIPAQEEHAPENALNPVFELSYWRFGLSVAARWAKELGEDASLWESTLNALADPPPVGGLYLAHQNCPDTFGEYNRDHPSMLFAHGFIPGERIDKAAMLRTADTVSRLWRKDTLWGWDFALCAMTQARLGRPETAMDILLENTPKNSYTVGGNNFQRGRSDLPLYLPGNGSLLFALAMFLAGYGNVRSCPGLPDNGRWKVEYEGISPLPY